MIFQRSPEPADYRSRPPGTTGSPANNLEPVSNDHLSNSMFTGTPPDDALDNAAVKLVLGTFQSAITAYVARRQRYGRSTTKPGERAQVAIDSMSCNTVRC